MCEIYKIKITEVFKIASVNYTFLLLLKLRTDPFKPLSKMVNTFLQFQVKLYFMPILW
jgi:hypothetical protein